MKLRLGSREANNKFPAVIQGMNDEAVLVDLRRNSRLTVYEGGRIKRS